MDPAPTFYLHEDEWGMINLLPSQNAAWAEDVAHQATQASRDNFAGFVEMAGSQIPTYNNVFVIPTEQHPIAELNISLDHLRTLLSNHWPEAAQVTSGYSTHTESLSGVFAFGNPNTDNGAFYGSHKDGKVTHLHILKPDYEDAEAVAAFEAALTELNSHYPLLIADWWQHSVTDVSDRQSLTAYLSDY